MPRVRLISFLTVLLTSVALYAQTDSVTKNSGKAELVMTKSPWAAVLRSAVLPGFGQFYNESYWKIPVFAGAAAWFTYNVYYNQDKYKQFADSYNKNGGYTDQKKRDFYRNQRDEFYIYLGLTYLLNMVDAYVDAHLFDFNVIDDTGGSAKFRITYTYRF